MRLAAACVLLGVVVASCEGCGARPCSTNGDCRAAEVCSTDGVCVPFGGDEGEGEGEGEARCGDGVRSGSEICDDGNDDELDTCKPNCTRTLLLQHTAIGAPSFGDLWLRGPTAVAALSGGRIAIGDNNRVFVGVIEQEARRVAGGAPLDHATGGTPLVPVAIAERDDGTLLVADFVGHVVWQTQPDGPERVFAGSGTAPDLATLTDPPAFSLGTDATAIDIEPRSVAVMPGTGTVLIATDGRVLAIDPDSGAITQVVGNVGGGAGGTAAQQRAFGAVQDIAPIDGTRFLIAGSGSGTFAFNIAEVDLSDGSIVPKTRDGFPLSPSCTGNLSDLVVLPERVAADGNGGLYFYDPAFFTLCHADGAGALRAVAGDGSFGRIFRFDEQPALEVQLGVVRDIAVLPDGRVLLADQTGDNVVVVDDAAGTARVTAGLSDLQRELPRADELALRGIQAITHDADEVLVATRTEVLGIALDGTMRVAAESSQLVEACRPDHIDVIASALAVDVLSGDLYLAHDVAPRICVVHPDGTSALFAGTGVVGTGNGTSAPFRESAEFAGIQAIDVRADGVVVMDGLCANAKMRLVPFADAAPVRDLRASNGGVEFCLRDLDTDATGATHYLDVLRLINSSRHGKMSSIDTDADQTLVDVPLGQQALVVGEDDGNFVVWDDVGHALRRFDPGASTLAVVTGSGFRDGPFGLAQLEDAAVDLDGAPTLAGTGVVALASDSAVRMIDFDATSVRTLLGTDFQADFGPRGRLLRGARSLSCREGLCLIVDDSDAIRAAFPETGNLRPLVGGEGAPLGVQQAAWLDEQHIAYIDAAGDVERATLGTEVVLESIASGASAIAVLGCGVRGSDGAVSSIALWVDAAAGRSLRSERGDDLGTLQEGDAAGDVAWACTQPSSLEQRPALEPRLFVRDGDELRVFDLGATPPVELGAPGQLGAVLDLAVDLRGNVLLLDENAELFQLDADDRGDVPAPPVPRLLFDHSEPGWPRDRCARRVDSSPFADIGEAFAVLDVCSGAVIEGHVL